MATIIPLISRTIRTLSTPLALSTVIKCAILSSLAFIALGVGLYVILSTTAMAGGWIETALDFFLGTVGTVLLSWFMFPIIMPAIASLFLDGYLEKMSEREYNVTLRSVPLREELPKTLWLLLQLLVLNILLFPFFFIPVIGQILYYGVNGYLLGKEFWIMACDRLMLDHKTLKDRSTTLIVAGALLVLCANIPFMNLITPIVAATFMMHLGHRALGSGRVTMRDATPKSHQITQSEQL